MSPRTRPGFLFAACPDSELLRAHIAGLLEQHPPESGQWTRHVFWADEGLVPAFWEKLTLQDLFGQSRAVVLRNAHLLKADQLKALVPALAAGRSHVWPFFCLEAAPDRGKIKIPAILKKQPYFRVAEDRGWLWTSPGLTERDLPGLVDRLAREMDLSFAPGARERLCSCLPTNATAIRREMEKLSLAVDESRSVTVELAAMSEHVPDMDIFAFIDSLQQGRNPGRVWQQIFSNRLAGEDMCFSFLAMLTREARILWRLMAGDGQVFLPQRVRDMKTRLARSLGPMGIARIFDLALAAEMGVKTGERSPDQALDLLTAELFRAFGGTGQARGRRP